MSKPTPDFIACSGPKPLPPELLLKAKALAEEIHPPNAVHGRAAGDIVLPPAALAMLTQKYWGGKPRKLPVEFMEATPRPLADKILKNMNAWTKTGCVEFVGTRRDGVIRISRETSGYWSYLGTDNLLIPAGQPTMSLQGFTVDYPDGEYRRVVRHEAGHALGFPHEHARKEIIDELDPEGTIAVFARLYGWPRQMTVQQVLTPLDARDLTEGPVEETSIMAYQFEAECVRSRRPIPGGTDITKADYAFIARVYPKPTTKVAMTRPADFAALIA